MTRDLRTEHGARCWATAHLKQSVPSLKPWAALCLTFHPLGVAHGEGKPVGRPGWGVAPTMARLTGVRERDAGPCLIPKPKPLPPCSPPPGSLPPAFLRAGRGFVDHPVPPLSAPISHRGKPQPRREGLGGLLAPSLGPFMPSSVAGTAVSTHYTVRASC